MISVDIAVRHDDTELFRPDFADSINIVRTGRKTMAVSKTVNTTPIQISLADLTAPGYAFIKNIGAAGTIDFGLYDGTQRTLIALSPGYVAIFPVKAGVTFGAVGSQPGCELFVLVYEA